MRVRGRAILHWLSAVGAALEQCLRNLRIRVHHGCEPQRRFALVRNFVGITTGVDHHRDSLGIVSLVACVVQRGPTVLVRIVGVPAGVQQALDDFGLHVFSTSFSALNAALRGGDGYAGRDPSRRCPSDDRDYRRTALSVRPLRVAGFRPDPRYRLCTPPIPPCSREPSSRDRCAGRIRLMTFRRTPQRGLFGAMLVVRPGTVQARRASSARSFPRDGRSRGRYLHPRRASASAIASIRSSDSCRRLPRPDPRVPPHRAAHAPTSVSPVFAPTPGIGFVPPDHFLQVRAIAPRPRLNSFIVCKRRGYTYMPATRMRDDMLAEGRGDHLDYLVNAACALQDSLFPKPSIRNRQPSTQDGSQDG